MISGWVNFIDIFLFQELKGKFMMVLLREGVVKDIQILQFLTVAQGFQGLIRGDAIVRNIEAIFKDERIFKEKCTG